MKLRTIANQVIKPHHQNISLRKRRYNTDDIITLVQEVLETDYDDTVEFASFFEKSIHGLHQIFDFVDQNFNYLEDPDFNQWVQTPSFLWYTKRGDCKSFTVFISSILRNMGVDHLIRYVSYGGRKLTHVYPVALIGNREVPIDVVWKKQEGGVFGKEKPYSRKIDYKVEGLYKLGNTQSLNDYIGMVETTIQELEAALADIPDSVVTAGPGDVTKFTKGELDRHIWADRYKIYAKQAPNFQAAREYEAAALAIQRGDIAGISGISHSPLRQQVQSILKDTATKNAPAFEPFNLQIPNPIPPKMEGFFKSIGNFFQQVGQTFKDLFTKFVNWIFKGAGKMMGPYFIFIFAAEKLIKSVEMRRRVKSQKKTFEWIQKTGKLDENQLKGVVINGIKEQTGQTPEEIFKEAGADKITGFTVVASAVFKAIGFVVEVIEKIVGLFKKNKEEGGEVNKENSSDPAILQEEAKLQQQAASATSTPASGGDSSGGSTGLLAALALGAGLFALQ